MTQSEPDPEITTVDPSEDQATADAAPSASERRSTAGERRSTADKQRSTARETKAHDFGVSGSWLNGDRSAAFQQALSEMARAAGDVLEHWTAAIEVEPTELDTISLASLPTGAGPSEPSPAPASDPADDANATADEAPAEAAVSSVHIVEMALDESGQTAFLLFDTALALSIVTLMLGGNGDPGPTRPLTPLESGLVSDLALALSERFAAELRLGPVRIKGHHSDRSTLRDGTSETLMSFGLHMAHAKAEGACRLVVSPLSLQVQMEIIDRRINGRRRTTSTPGAAAAAALQPVVVPVVIGFAAIRVPAMDMANLHPGDLLRTGQSLGRQLIASVGDAPVFTVKAGQRGDRLVAEVLSIPQHDFPALSTSALSTSAPTQPFSQGAKQ